MNRQELENLDRRLRAECDARLKSLGIPKLSADQARSLDILVRRESDNLRNRARSIKWLRNFSSIAAAALIILTIRMAPPHAHSGPMLTSAAAEQSLADWLDAADQTSDYISRLTNDHVLLVNDDPQSAGDVWDNVDESLQSFNAIYGA